MSYSAENGAILEVDKKLPSSTYTFEWCHYSGLLYNNNIYGTSLV